MMSAFQKCFRVVCVAMLLAGAGCQVLGAVMNRATPAPKQPAKYVPPKEPLLVLVENYHTAGEVETDAAHLSVALVQTLKANDVAPTVDTAKLEQLRDANPEGYDKMKVDAIGRFVGAKQVLYVNVISAGIDTPTGGGALRGSMRAMVRLVDCGTGETRWPQDSRNGELVSIITTWERDDGERVRLRVRGEMADEMAEAIGDLFHPWTASNDANSHLDSAH